MKLNENEVIEFLSENYAGSVASRALWVWAGGGAQDIDYTKSATDQWNTMWEKASEDGPPSKIALLREALFDDPGNEVVLGFLNAIADDEFKSGRAAAPVLTFMLEKLDPAFDEKVLQATMLSFPKEFSEDADDPENISKESQTEIMFAALASSLQDRFKKDVRSALEEKCEVLTKDQGLASEELISEGMLVLLECLPKMAEAAKTPEVQAAAKEIHAVLEPLTKKEDANDAVDKLTPLIERLKTMADDSGDKMFLAGCNGLDNQFKCLQCIYAETPLHSLEYLAKALIQALWGTTGIQEDETEAEESEDEAETEAEESQDEAENEAEKSQDEAENVKEDQAK